MGTIKLTMFDFNIDPDDDTKSSPKEPITVELEYDADLTLEEQGVQKVSIYVGDNVVGGQVVVPLAMLNEAMGALMAGYLKREAENKPSIIMPDKPKFII